jgi:hypothetical protein
MTDKLKNKVSMTVTSDGCDDGWNEEHEGIEALIDVLDTCAEMQYELKCCIRGSYYSESEMQDGDDLREAVLCLAQSLKDSAEELK